MHNLILHWFGTLAPVESGEVRVCSYSLSDIMPMAILLSVPEPTHVIQPNCHDTVLAINDPKPKRSVCFKSRDSVFLGTGLSVFRDITL